MNTSTEGLPHEHRICLNTIFTTENREGTTFINTLNVAWPMRHSCWLEKHHTQYCVNIGTIFLYQIILWPWCWIWGGGYLTFENPAAGLPLTSIASRGQWRFSSITTSLGKLISSWFKFWKYSPCNVSHSSEWFNSISHFIRSSKCKNEGTSWG